jgi:hypothetical protein
MGKMGDRKKRWVPAASCLNQKMISRRKERRWTGAWVSVLFCGTARLAVASSGAAPVVEVSSVPLLARSHSPVTEIPAKEPKIAPSWAWTLFQFLPSPQFYSGAQGQVGWGMRWQVTPVLYSWGLNPRLRPWRFGVVEPLTRQSGSVEIYVSPEKNSDWMLRSGLRAYFPWIEKGEGWSSSLGVSWVYSEVGSGLVPSLEAGLYGLFGFLGFQLTWNPPGNGRSEKEQWIATLRVRVF